MSMELIAIIGVGVTLAGLILNGQHNLRNEIGGLREEINGLREEINGLRKKLMAGTHGTSGRIA